MLRPTVSRPVCLGVKHPSGAQDKIFVTVTQLRVCSCGAPNLTRGRVCRLQLLLALASAVIFTAVKISSTYLQFLVDTYNLQFTCNFSMYVRTIYTRLGIAAHCCNSCSSCCNGCLVTWMVVHLTADKFKSHLFFRGCVWPLLVPRTISLCNHIYTVHGKTRATRGPVCALEMYQWRGETCFASAAISKDGYL
jgi:hypothetical protein